MKRITTIFIILCMLINDDQDAVNKSTADIYKMMEDESLKECKQ